jgi:cupin fold WbuC family metalloprotein
MQLDSCIPPHRHHGPDKDEAFVVLRGALGVLLFNDAGEVVQTARVGAAALCVPGNPLRWQATALGVDIAHGAWHTDVALEADTVFLEAKAGPWPIGRRSPNGARAAMGENPDYRRCADSTHKKDPRQDGFNMT